VEHGDFGDFYSSGSSLSRVIKGGTKPLFNTKLFSMDGPTEIETRRVMDSSNPYGAEYLFYNKYRRIEISLTSTGQELKIDSYIYGIFPNSAGSSLSTAYHNGEWPSTAIET
jgi:hypothetical protein